MLTAIDEIERKKRVAASIHPTWLPEFGNNCNSFHHSFPFARPDRRTHQQNEDGMRTALPARTQSAESAISDAALRGPGTGRCGMCIAFLTFPTPCDCSLDAERDVSLWCETRVNQL